MKIGKGKYTHTHAYVMEQDRNKPENEQTIWNLKLFQRDEVNEFLAAFKRCEIQKGNKIVINPQSQTRVENEQLLKAVESIENVDYEIEDGKWEHYDKIDNKDMVLKVLRDLTSAEAAELSEASVNYTTLQEGTKKK